MTSEDCGKQTFDSNDTNMKIDSIFNETELAIFHGQTGFSFSEIYKYSDGTIFAVDRQSRQIFAGEDLRRNNVHPFDSLTFVGMEGGKIHLTFKDSSSFSIVVDEVNADEIMAELQDIVGTDTACPEDATLEPADSPKEPQLSAEEWNETYSRLVNTGRSTARAYLMSELGMSSEEAGDYLDKLEGKETLEKTLEEAVPDPDYKRDGSMTKKAILKTVRKLRPGDMVHLEYKPLIGKLRVYDTQYLNLVIDVSESRYFSLRVSNVDYQSLMDDAADELFDHMGIYILSKANRTEISCYLKRIKMLRIIPKDNI